MTSRLTLLFISIIIHVAYSQEEDTKTTPKFLLKTGAAYNYDFSSLTNSGAFFNAETEILLSSKSTIRFGFEAYAGQTVNEMEFRVPFLSYRHYFKPMTGSGIADYTGFYLGAVGYLSGRKGVTKDEKSTIWNSELFVTNPTFLPKNGFGFEYGSQLFGLIDFGVFAGIESLDEKVQVINNDVQLESAFSPILQSYSRFTIPLTLNKEFYQNIAVYYKPSFSRNKLLRLGINDVFAFSKKGLFFHPKIAFEQNFGKSYFSGLAKVSGLMARAKYYDITRFDSVSEVSEKAFLNQTVAFSGTAQLRYYVGRVIKRNQNYLNGIYLFGDASIETGSTEIKRQYWEFEKFSSHFLGGGLGFQLQLFSNMLADSYLAIGKASGPAMVKSGVELYWVK